MPELTLKRCYVVFIGWLSRELGSSRPPSTLSTQWGDLRPQTTVNDEVSTGLETRAYPRTQYNGVEKTSISLSTRVITNDAFLSYLPLFLTHIFFFLSLSLLLAISPCLVFESTQLCFDDLTHTH